jgi:hypothetical protein
VSKPRSRIFVSIVIPLVIIVLLSRPVAAAGMTAGSGVSDQECLGSNTGQGYVLATDQGPAGETWTDDVKFGLVGNDNTQYAYFAIQVIDLAEGDTVAIFGDTHYNWVAQGQVVQGTMTVYVQGEYEIYIYIDNADSQSQCFEVSLSPWYWS